MASVENNRRSIEPMPEPSRDLVRALNHLAALERGEIEERYGVLPSVFTHFGMFPLTAPDEAEPVWKRKNTFGTVLITRGVVYDEQGEPTLARYPSGGIPRLFLIDLASEILAAERRGEKHPGVIDLTDTLNRYTTQRLGLKAGSQNRAVLEQVTATARATISLSNVTPEKRGGALLKVRDMPRVADEYQLWIPDANTLGGLEPTITLTEGFVRLVLEDQRVPVRRDVLSKLAGKPMAFDALLWLGNATYSLHRSGKHDTFFDWPYLFATFTHEYARIDSFVTKFKAAITEALRYYPDCRVEIVRGNRAHPGGIRVSRSPLMIDPITRP